MNQSIQHSAKDNKNEIRSSSPRHTKGHRGLWKRIAAAVAGVAVVGAAVFAGVSYFHKQAEEDRQNQLLKSDAYYSGIVVEGMDLGGKSKDEAKKAVQQAQTALLPKYDIQLTYGDKNWSVTAQDLGIQFNTDTVLEEAYAYARTGSDEERLLQIDALKKAPKEYKLTMTKDAAVLQAKLKDIAGTIDTAPVNATVASFDSATATFQYEDGKNGLAVDSAALLQKINALVDGEGTGTIEIPVKTVPFDVSQALLKSHMQKLGSYTTTSTNTADGNHNMKLAASAINGSVLQPGEVFSFNQATGDSNKPANGYRKAVAISGGKKVMEYGGGVCQVSSTLYGAVIRSNMEITSRANHMWRSSYVPVGLDATVSYPYLDFKFKNPTQYPVYIVAGMSGTKVTVTMYGYQSPEYDKIEVTSRQTSTVAQPEDQYVTDKSLKKGEKVLDRKGNAGIRAAAQCIYYLNGKVVKTENLPSSYYRAIANIYKVGPGTDTPSSSSAASSSAPPASSSSHASSKPASSAPASSAPASSAPASSHTSETGSDTGEFIQE